MKDDTGQRDDAPSLRDALSNAFDAVESADDATTTPSTSPATAGADASTPPPTSAPADGPATDAAPAATTPAAAPGASDAPKMPPGFPGGEAAWGALPPDARSWVKNREGQVERYIRTNAEAAKFGGAMWNAIRPYEASIRAAGAHPAQVVQEAMNMHHVMTQGSQADKAAAFQRMAQHYGVDLPSVADQSQQGAQVSPEVAELRNTVRSLVQYLRGGEEQQTQAQYAQAQHVVSSFTSDPQREYANREDVRQIMANFIETGDAQTLEQAYEMAVWTRPDIRAVLHEKGAARKAEEARAAAGSATARGGAPVAAVMQPDNQSLRGLIESAWDASSKRAA